MPRQFARTLRFLSQFPSLPRRKCRTFASAFRSNVVVSCKLDFSERQKTRTYISVIFCGCAAKIALSRTKNEWLDERFSSGQFSPALLQRGQPRRSTLVVNFGEKSRTEPDSRPCSHRRSVSNGDAMVERIGALRFRNRTVATQDN